MGNIHSMIDSYHNYKITLCPYCNRNHSNLEKHIKKCKLNTYKVNSKLPSLSIPRGPTDQGGISKLL